MREPGHWLRQFGNFRQRASSWRAPSHVSGTSERYQPRWVAGGIKPALTDAGESPDLWIVDRFSGDGGSHRCALARRRCIRERQSRFSRQRSHGPTPPVSVPGLFLGIIRRFAGPLRLGSIVASGQIKPVRARSPAHSESSPDE